ncbi:MAG: Asp23/Gls24 family envelope stress response protein [Ruminococcus sp.]|nr:Asp23/Gls24 family envelope stress response protein [Ruminococcus sp.]
MDEVKKEASSKLKISEDVIITVAKLAALDVRGVAALSGEVSKMSKLRGNGPIKVSMMGDVAAIDISIKVKGGVRAPAVAEEVQTAVKENVQNMTGVAVARVNVIVAGAVFDEPKENENDKA